jgi:hypothetical protein
VRNTCPVTIDGYEPRFHLPQQVVTFPQSLSNRLPIRRYDLLQSLRRHQQRYVVQ